MRYAVDVVNRYSSKRIVIEDPSIEELRVSGTMMENHVDGWIASLNQVFGVQAVEDGERIRLRRAATR